MKFAGFISQVSMDIKTMWGYFVLGRVGVWRLTPPHQDTYCCILKTRKTKGPRHVPDDKQFPGCSLDSIFLCGLHLKMTKE